MALIVNHFRRPVPGRGILMTGYREKPIWEKK
jgi:hypothetical protein